MNKFEEEGNEYLIICNALDEELRRLMHNFEELLAENGNQFDERGLDDFKRVALIRNKYMRKEKEARAKAWEEYRKEQKHESTT